MARIRRPSVIANEPDESRAEVEKTTLPLERQRVTRRSGRQNFAYWDPEAQREAFWAWLPRELQEAPGINWTTLPPEIMGYCVKTIRNSPDAAVLALAAASMHGAISVSSQRTKLKEITGLLRSLRAGGHIQSLSDLKQEPAC